MNGMGHADLSLLRMKPRSSLLSQSSERGECSVCLRRRVVQWRQRPHLGQILLPVEQHSDFASGTCQQHR